MTVIRMTARRSMVWAAGLWTALRGAAKCSGELVRVTLASVLAVFLAVGPVFAQDPGDDQICRHRVLLVRQAQGEALHRL